MKTYIAVITLFLPLIISQNVEAKSTSADIVLHEGEIQLLKVNINEAKLKPTGELKARIFNLSFPIFKAKDSFYYALLSAPLGVAKGEFSVEVLQGSEVIESFNVPVENLVNTSTEEILDAPEANVIPQDAATISRISREDAEQKALFQAISSERLWSGPFVKPVDFPITSRFGIYRLYSSHMRRRTHWGVDFKTPVGTPVKVASSGVVVMARNLYFPGKTVIVDHGNGLYTGYSHLENMRVKVGQKVKAGQILGRSGRSGKITGAHLHWFAVNARVKFDPLKLLEVNLAETQESKE